MENSRGSGLGGLSLGLAGKSGDGGGPGITRSDLLVINKIDLAPHVGADLAIMERDAKKNAARGPSCLRI